MSANSISVAIRCRPLATGEKSIVTTGKSTISVMAIDKSQKQYTFNYIYNSTSTQQDIYNSIGKSVVSDATNGYNSCVFAYGLTGCFGKDTNIMLIDGTYKKVQDIDTNDILMGDDSTPRTVTQLIRNTDHLYHISSIDGFDSYTVNAKHIMVFTVYLDPRIDFNESEIKWQVTWFCGKMCKYKCKKFKCAENAQKYASALDKMEFVTMPLETYILCEFKEKYYLATTHVNFPHRPIYCNISQYASKLYADAQVNMQTICSDLLYNSLQIRTELLDCILSLSTYQSIQKRYVLVAQITNIEYLVKSLNKRIYKINKNTFYISDQVLYPVVATYVNYDNYYGFSLSGNNMFIGAGFNILHNSGKTHTMIGDEKDEGLTTRICRALTSMTSTTSIYRIEFSYMEIYSERVYDLLHPISPLEVRQHPEYGPYVEGLTQVVVENYEQLHNLIEKGNANRTTAKTLMNINSSRSHAIATIHFTQIKDSHEIVSKINLVDLAGSERIDLSGVTGINLKEAININKSLSQLGLVISNLAKRQIPSKIPTTVKRLSTTKSTQHINYRDSSLTWILKESLGGNSKTYMIATISPSSNHRLDTISTLQYAQNASKIINTVTVNEDTTNKIIGVLKSEIDELRSKLKNSSITNLKQLQIDLHEREELMKEKEKSWECKLADSKAHINIHQQQKVQLQQQLHIVVSERDQLLKSHDHFEKTKLVETAMELQYQYEKKFEQLRASYEEKLRKQNLEEVEKLRTANITLKESLCNSQRELQIQMRQFTIDRSHLTKQIQQLQSKIHNIESQIIKQQHAEEERKYLEFCAEYTQLDKKIEDGKKQLEDLNICRDSILEEITTDNEKISKIREQYAELKINFENEKSQYNTLLTKKEELHTYIVTLRTSLEDSISDAKGHFATLSIDDLERIKNNFDDLAAQLTTKLTLD